MIIITGLLILVAGTIALVLIEPLLESAPIKIVTFTGYIIGAAIFALVAVDYGREAGLGTLYILACALVVGLAIVYLLVSLVVNSDDVVPPQASSQYEATTPEPKQTNYVPAEPAKPRRYRSATRRTLNAIKVHKPREHWTVNQ